MTLLRIFGVAAGTATAFFLIGCVSLPPDPVTGANYARITSGMTKDQVFAILGPGTQQSETTMNGMTLQIYVWTPYGNPYAQVQVTFKDGLEMSKVKVGL